MSQHQTADSIEADAARVRAQLVDVGADLRAHADPSVIVDTAKASLARRTKEVPRFLRRNASPIGLVVLGGAVGVALTGLFVKPPRKSRQSEFQPAPTPIYAQAPRPSAKAQLEAALLSTAAVGLGYLAGLLIPETQAEERLLGEPKAVLRAQLDAFLQQHLRGVRQAAANLFGASRLSATALIALAAVAEALSGAKRGAERPSR